MHNGSWKLIQEYKHFAKYFKTLLFKFYPVSIVLLVVMQPPIHLVFFFLVMMVLIESFRLRKCDVLAKYICLKILEQPLTN